MNRPATMRKILSQKYFQYCLLTWIACSAWRASADQSADQNAAPDTRPQNAFERSLGLYKASADEDDWTRHFRMGALVGFNISANFKTSGDFNISGNNNVANGIYDDGYVRVDQTGNAGGGTSYWGYDNASQYTGQTLTLHSSSSYSTQGSSNASADGDPSVGLDLAYGGNLWYWRHVRIGWEFGFGLLPVTVSDNHTMLATVNQSVYTFGTEGIILPAAPYHADNGGKGPGISDVRTQAPDQTYRNVAITGTRKLDVILYTLRLGPTFYGDLSEKIAVAFGAGPAVGIVDGSYKYDETITAGGINSHNSGNFGATDIVFGGYVNTTLMYHFMDNNRNADVYIGAQYMPMSDATFSRGGREGRLNLSGQVNLSIGLNWPF